jgi:two-component system sensor histidine kinase DesK
VSVDRASAVASPFHRELVLGRIVMIGFMGVFLFREFWSVEVDSSSARAVVIVGSTVLALTWTWFWAVVAAGSNQVAAGLAVVLMTISAAVLVAVNHIGVFPFYFAVIVAGAAFPWRVGTVLVVLVVGLTLAVWWPEGQSDATALQVFGISALLGGAAVTVRRFVEAQVELDATREELLGFAALEARMAMARDLHDRLGQQLTVSIMQSELLAMDLEGGSVEEARARAASVVTSSRRSLELMRETVSDRREPDVRTEVAQARRALTSAGVSCTTSVDTGELPPDVDRVLGWVAREGTTNVLRHSRAGSCRIEVVMRGGSVVLRIDDDGEGIGAGGGGTGIEHLRERLGTVGGSISLTDVAGGGCALLAEVPLGA